MTPLLLLHDQDASAWREVLDAGGWTGPWLAADLPDHDYYDPADLIMVALRWLRDAAWSDKPVVVALRQQAVVGELLAVGGRASALVLVDAAPVLDVGPDEGQRLTYQWLNAVADGEPRDLLPPLTDAAWAARQRAAIAVPVLEIEEDRPAEIVRAIRAWWGDAVGAQR